MNRLSQNISQPMCFSRLVFCLAILSLFVGCSKSFIKKRADAEKTWVCNEAADDAMERKHYNAGILLHKRFLAQEPHNALALYHLGYAYGQTGDHLKEVSYYENAISLGFEEGQIFFNSGMAYGELGEWEQSIRTFKKAIDIDPHSADNHFGLAMAYQGSSSDSFAEKEYLKALKLQPNHLGALQYLSMLYTDRGELRKAAELLERILEIDPSDSSAQEFLERLKKE